MRKITFRKIVVDFVPAFLGVLVALLLNDWRESIKENKFIDQSLEAVYKNNIDNINNLELSIDNLTANVDSLGKYLESDLSIIDVLHKNNGVKLKPLNTSAIHTIKNSNLYLSFEYDVISKLTNLEMSIERIQQDYIKQLTTFLVTSGDNTTYKSKKQFFILLKELLNQLYYTYSTSSSLNKTLVINELVEELVESNIPLYIGTYTDKSSKGIYLGYLNTTNGEIILNSLAGVSENPSYFAISNDNSKVLCVNENSDFDGKNSGALSKYKILPSGKLKLLSQVSSHGAHPCFVSIQEKSILVANYSGGNSTIYSNGLKSKPIIINHKQAVQDTSKNSAHAHSIKSSKSGKFIYTADLGLDKLLIFERFSDSVKFHSSIDLEKGSGPRHFEFTSNEKFLYVINELNSTISLFLNNTETAELKPIQTITTLPEDFKGKSYCADIHISPNGKYLYGSNRGDNSIVVFKVNKRNGKLKPIQHISVEGVWPRNFVIDPTGKYLLVANQKSDNITSFKIRRNGKLEYTGHQVNLSKPVCLKFLNR